MRSSDQSRVAMWRCAAALVLTAGGASAVSPRESRANDTIRCVAVTGGSAGAITGARFAVIEHATVGANGSIAFRAALEVGAGGVTTASDSTLWLIHDDGSGVGGTPVLVAREGEQAPGLPLGAAYAELGSPGLSQAGDSVVFWTRLAQGSGDVTALNDRAIYRFAYAAGSGSAAAFVRTGDASLGVPLGSLAFIDGFRDQPAVGLNGYPAFAGTLVTGPGGVPVDQSHGIWTNDLDNEVVMIAREGDAAPDIVGAVYADEFTNPVISTAGDLAHRARLRRGVGGVDATNDQGIWVRLALNEARYIIARTGDQAGNGSTSSTRFETLDPPIVTAEPRVAFRATLRQGIGGVNSTNNEALFSRCPCGAMFAEVREGWPAFGQPAGVQFDSFTSPAFSRDGRMLFGARLRGGGVTAANDTTVWWSDLPIRFIIAAREGSLAPGGNGATFANFDFGSEFWIASALGNQMIFPATLSSGVRGVWVFTPERGVRCLVKEGDSVEVAPGDTRQIVSLAPRTEGLVHDGRRTSVSSDRHFTFLATLTDGATGVFVADLPPIPLGCPSDWNNDAVSNSQDFFDFLTDFFDGAADLNTSGFTDSQDMFDFLTAFFSGC